MMPCELINCIYMYRRKKISIVAAISIEAMPHLIHKCELKVKFAANKLQCFAAIMLALLTLMNEVMNELVKS